jgi:hypothetical protein
MAAHAFLSLGQHPLAPSADIDPIRFLLDKGKAYLVCGEEYLTAFETLWRDNTAGAEAELVLARRSAEDASRHLARSIELLLSDCPISGIKRLRDIGTRHRYIWVRAG